MINNMILNAIGNNQETHKILALFRNGREITFTMNILETLRQDPEIIEIIDLETGEYLKFE